MTRRGLIGIQRQDAEGVLAVLAANGWSSAVRGLEALASLRDFSYRAEAMAPHDAAALYATRAENLAEAGREGVEVRKFVEALERCHVPVVIFSVADSGWACVCAASADSLDPVAATAIRVGAGER